MNRNQRIAILINRRDVATSLIAAGYNRHLWESAYDEATVDLADTYGIALPAVQISRDRLARHAAAAAAVRP